MSRRAHFVILAATAAFLLGTAAAADAGKSARSSVVVSSIIAPDETLFVFGELTSGNRRCVDNRRVAVDFVRETGGRFRIDVARSGRNGGWSAAAAIDDVTSQGPSSEVVVKVDSRKVKVPGGDRLTCKGAKTVYPLVD